MNGGRDMRANHVGSRELDLRVNDESEDSAR